MIIITIYGITYYYTLCVELAAFKQDIITAKKFYHCFVVSIIQ